MKTKYVEVDGVKYKLLGTMYEISQRDLRNNIYLTILYIFGFGALTLLEFTSPSYGFALAGAIGVLGWLLEKRDKEFYS